MNKIYSDWIKTNVPLDVLGKCLKYSEEMKKCFSELILRKGFYYDFLWGRRMHYWLEDSDGNIIDPTSHQFPSKGNGEYESLEEDELPKGKCMECGELYFINDYNPFCSLSCSSISVNDLNDLIRKGEKF